MTSVDAAMWDSFSRANRLNPAQRHRWRLVCEEARSAAPSGPLVVVDLGCGQGLLLAHLARLLPKARRIGIDVEPRALELARVNEPSSEYVLGDLQAGALSLPQGLEGQTGVVVCSEVLEHLRAPEEALRLARRLLSPNGCLVVTVPGGGVTRFDRAIGHVRHYDAASLSAALTGAGLRVVRMYRWGFPFHSLFRLAVSLAPASAEPFRDGRLSAAVRLGWEAAYTLFFLNVKHRRLGRQLVAVATRGEGTAS